MKGFRVIGSSGKTQPSQKGIKSLRPAAFELPLHSKGRLVSEHGCYRRSHADVIASLAIQEKSALVRLAQVCEVPFVGRTS